MVSHVALHTTIFSTKFEVDTTTRFEVDILYVTLDCDLDLWLFDLKRSTYIARHMIKPHTDFQHPTFIRS